MKTFLTSRLRRLASYLLVLLTLVGCQPAGQGSSEKVALKSEPARPVKVKTVSVVQKDVLRKTRQPASIKPFYETDLRCKVAGFVIDVQADIGDFVMEGKVLARIDVPEMQRQRKVIESRIEALRAQEKAAEAGVALATASVSAAKAELQQAEAGLMDKNATLEARSAECERMKELVGRGAVQQKLLDEAEQRCAAARAGQAAAKATIESIVSKIQVAEAEVAAAEANAVAASTQTTVVRGELEELDVSIAYAEIKAPFTGVVTERNINLGDLVETGTNTPALFVLNQVDRVRIQVPVPEMEAPFVQPGDVMTVTFPAFASEPPLSVPITRVSGALHPSTRTITVEAVVDNEDGKLLPGMFGEASIGMETKVATNVLPSRAVRFDEAGNAFVYIVDGGNRIRVAEISTGFDTGTEIEVLSGVESGTQVVGPHLTRFREGDIVEVL